MHMHLNEKYWSERYKNNKTGWDIGKASHPLKTYFGQLKDKKAKILIPGAGNAYEAEYLWHSGFENVFVLDIAEAPLNNIISRCPSFPSKQLVQENFFEHQGSYDLVIEQTFFCALKPAFRSQYVEKMHELLLPSGKLVGVLFNNVFIDRKEPPFGATLTTYQQLFSRLFDISVLEPCYNSIAPRQGNELFLNCSPKSSY